MNILVGLNAGVCWALDTVILGIALSKVPFINNVKIIMLAPLISTFFHDFFSSIWIMLYMGIKKRWKKVFLQFTNRGGRLIMVASILGGPVGMGGYVFSIRYLGVSYTTMLSAIYPAIGAFLSFVFLKERLKIRQVMGFLLAIAGMCLLGIALTGQEEINLFAGGISIVACILGWALEIVICAYAMKIENVDSQNAYVVRQLCSSFFQFVFLVILFNNLAFLKVYPVKIIPIIAVAGLAGMVSYMCYYYAINKIGASKSMALNITYAAWGIILDAVILHNKPTTLQIICGIMIVMGALMTAWDPKE